jgi:tRNA pseudouridine55 synthase
MDGLLLVDKPIGCTSHDIVDRVRRALKIRAVGHAGTLDPFASGLLILGIGRGTKALTALVGTDKEYDVTIELGKRTDTFDSEGKFTEEVDPTKPHPTLAQVNAALLPFTGTFEQKAPLYSAKKLHGTPLYQLARAGTATEELRPVKEVTISTLEVRSYAWPLLELHVHCSSGTYIRSLADDLGQTLGVGGYAIALRRTMVGTYTLEQALSGKELTEEKIQTALLALPSPTATQNQTS